METNQTGEGPSVLDTIAWNNEDAVDLDRPSAKAAYELSISSRDWTVETIVQQIRQGNIDLGPDFQRRNAWQDTRRSLLIESFILSFPVPQIVLAENPLQKRSFIVIDGKQRLMTIAGMYLPEYRPYWKSPRFVGLEILGELEGMRIDDFLDSSESSISGLRRQLANADIRTTLISGFQGEQVLYDIFYRINNGSVPLSTQELRQVLHRGEFAQYLLRTTNVKNPFWQMLRIKEPDARLRDVELLLRIFAWALFSKDYAGNMKKFLDDTTKRLNDTWDSSSSRIESIGEEISAAVTALGTVYSRNAGRKYKDGKYESALNRAVFEVQAYFFVDRSVRASALHRKEAVRDAFKLLSITPEFLASVESTTKSLANTRSRFSLYANMLAETLQIDVVSPSIGTV